MPHGASLDWLNFLLADVRGGLGPYVSVFLLTEAGWDQATIGAVLTVSGLIGITMHTPMGLIIDATHSKRALLIGGVGALSGCALAIAWQPDRSGRACGRHRDGRARRRVRADSRRDHPRSRRAGQARGPAWAQRRVRSGRQPDDRGRCRGRRDGILAARGVLPRPALRNPDHACGPVDSGRRHRPCEGAWPRDVCRGAPSQLARAPDAQDTPGAGRSHGPVPLRQCADARSGKPEAGAEPSGAGGGTDLGRHHRRATRHRSLWRCSPGGRTSSGASRCLLPRSWRCLRGR